MTKKSSKIGNKQNVRKSNVSSVISAKAKKTNKTVKNNYITSNNPILSISIDPNLIAEIINLKHMSKQALMLLRHFPIDSGFEKVRLAFFHKATDLIEGILQLQAMDLMECAQALIRVLFETNLNYGYLIKIASENSEEIAFQRLIDSVIIMKEKDAASQNLLEGSGLKETAKTVKARYTKKEIDNIKKHGFSQLSIFDRAQADRKIDYYNYMYRNFSRNVHANDFQEYYLKQDPTYNHDYNDRNEMAIYFTYICMYQIFFHMCKTLGLIERKELNKINKRHKEFCNRD